MAEAQRRSVRSSSKSYGCYDIIGKLLFRINHFGKRTMHLRFWRDDDHLPLSNRIQSVHRAMANAITSVDCFIRYF